MCFMCFLRSALPQLVNKDSWCQNSTKEWGLRMRILFNDFGIKRKLTWPLMRILNLPVIHTFPTQGSSVPQEPRMYLLFYSTNIFISLGTSRWGGGEQKFSHMKWSQITSNATGQSVCCTSGIVGSFPEYESNCDLHSYETLKCH